MSDDIKGWLEKLGLGKYAKIFSENEIDFRVLPRLSEDDLKELGLPMGARRNLQAAIERLPEGLMNPNPPLQQGSTTIPSGAERRQLTVMFCDLVDSTALTQRLDPEELQEIIRRYQDTCKAAVERYEGYIARYMGDGVLVYFGYPRAHEDDAERAIHAALELVDSISNLNEGLVKPYQVSLAIRIGIATGLVVVGDIIGEGASLENAVVGETPNLAARLQARAGINGIVIGPKTCNLAGGRFEYESLGPLELSGMTKSIQAWKVVAASEAESRFEAKHRTGVTPLVGREHEIGLLLERWQHAKEGDGQVVLLSGEPGIGKSRIIEAVRERTQLDRPIRLSYQCSVYHVNSSLHPIIEQLGRAAHFESSDSNSTKMGKLESLLSQAMQGIDTATPLIGSLLSIPFESRYASLDMKPEKQKEATLEVLVSQLEGLSRRQPVLLIFEDAHWADPTSLELLGLLVERVQSLPVLMVVTFRPEFSPLWPDHTHTTSLALSRFSRSLVVSMISRIAGGKDLPDVLCDKIIDKTDGVPLFVEELTKTVLESNLLEDRGGYYELRDSLPTLAIPSTLHDSLMARLDRLARVKEVAQIAAVIGREFSREILASVSLLTEQELDNALNQLVDAALIFPRGTSKHMRYVFKHALVQDAAYKSLLNKKRRDLHGRIARSLEGQVNRIAVTEPELLAYHYTEAGLTEPALLYWLRAGKVAGEHGAYIEAVAHLERGLTLLETLPEDDARTREEITFRVALGVPLMSVKGVKSIEVERNYIRARALCEKSDETDQLFPVLWGSWFCSMMSSNLYRACELADQLLEVARDRNDDALELEAHHCQWASRFLVGDFNAALEHSVDGNELYRTEEHHVLTFTFGGHDPGVCARDVRALALWLSGFPVQAQRQLDASFKLAMELGHNATLANHATYRTALSAFQRNETAMARHSDTLTEFVPIEPVYVDQSFADGALGWAMFQKGERKEGLALMRRSVSMGLLENPWGIVLVTLVANALARDNSTEEGSELLDETLNHYQSTNVHWWDSEIYRVKGELLLMQNNLDEALVCFAKAIEIAETQRAKSLELRSNTSLARVLKTQGKKESAREILEPIYGWFDEGFETVDLRDAKTLLDNLSRTE